MHEPLVPVCLVRATTIPYKLDEARQCFHFQMATRRLSSFSHSRNRHLGDLIQSDPRSSLPSFDGRGASPHLVNVPGMSSSVLPYVFRKLARNPGHAKDGPIFDLYLRVAVYLVVVSDCISWSVAFNQALRPIILSD